MLITSRCSGGCLPCPFSKKDCPERYLPAEDVVSRLQSSKARLVVITGGEPLEHPQFLEILSRIQPSDFAPSQGRFRIATGGHVPLQESIKKLKKSIGFAGFSMGTDVLSHACPKRSEHSLIWAKNVEGLNAAALPYSLTLTLHDSKDSQLPFALIRALHPLRRASVCGAKPEFIYVRVATNQYALKEVIREISTTFDGIDVVLENLSN